MILKHILGYQETNSGGSTDNPSLVIRTWVVKFLIASYFPLLTHHHHCCWQRHSTRTKATTPSQSTHCYHIPPTRLFLYWRNFGHDWIGMRRWFVWLMIGGGEVFCTLLLGLLPSPPPLLPLPSTFFVPFFLGVGALRFAFAILVFCLDVWLKWRFWVTRDLHLIKASLDWCCLSATYLSTGWAVHA